MLLEPCQDVRIELLCSVQHDPVAAVVGFDSAQLVLLKRFYPFWGVEHAWLLCAESVENRAFEQLSLRGLELIFVLKIHKHALPEMVVWIAESRF